MAMAERFSFFPFFLLQSDFTKRILRNGRTVDTFKVLLKTHLLKLAFPN